MEMEPTGHPRSADTTGFHGYYLLPIVERRARPLSPLSHCTVQRERDGGPCPCRVGLGHRSSHYDTMQYSLCSLTVHRASLAHSALFRAVVPPPLLLYLYHSILILYVICDM